MAALAGINVNEPHSACGTKILSALLISTSELRISSTISLGVSPDPPHQVARLQGGPSARGLGYVDISSDSYRGYPEMELMST